MQFNLIEYLDDAGISYYESGKNISNNWIGLNCPYCDDSSNHLGINLESKIFSCFRCGEKGRITKLIMKLENKHYNEIIPIIKQYGRMDKYEYKTDGEKSNIPIKKLILDKSDILYGQHKDYLHRRGFDPDLLEHKYMLRSGRITSEYKHRILIPYRIKGKDVSFSTRDVSGLSTVKYIHCPVFHSIVAPKEMLYNVDNCKDSCIVVEGTFDVFRIGSGSVALSGIQYTTNQLLVLSKFKRIFLLFDPEEKAQEMALQLGRDLTFCSSSIEVVQIKIDCDPGDMKDEDVKHLKRELFGRNM
jgi:DNA primase